MKVIQMPLDDNYAEKLEADAIGHERVSCRQAAWIVRAYYDGKLVPALPIPAAQE